MEAPGGRFLSTNDYLILIIREFNIFAGLGRQVRTPTWLMAGISGRRPNLY